LRAGDAWSHRHSKCETDPDQRRERRPCHPTPVLHSPSRPDSPCWVPAPPEGVSYPASAVTVNTFDGRIGTYSMSHAAQAMGGGEVSRIGGGRYALRSKDEPVGAWARCLERMLK
jgi:hypothetical protein